MSFFELIGLMAGGMIEEGMKQQIREVSAMSNDALVAKWKQSCANTSPQTYLDVLKKNSNLKPL